MIKHTTVENWNGRVFHVLDGEQITVANELIDILVLQELLAKKVLPKNTSYERWKDLNKDTYIMYKDNYIVECYDKFNNKVVWS